MTSDVRSVHAVTAQKRSVLLRAASAMAFVPAPVAQAAPAPPAPPPPGVQRLCMRHDPGRRRAMLKYWFFKAVCDGCPGCVRILVQDLGVDKYVTSDMQQYTAKDFADWYDQPAMKVYLDML